MGIRSKVPYSHIYGSNATSIALRLRLRRSQRGQFRLDLYHRLSVLPLQLPALRERSEDIALLVRHFAHEASLAYRREPVRFSDPAMQRMRVHRWPGNVRQLQNVVARLVITANGTLIDASRARSRSRTSC